MNEWAYEARGQVFDGADPSACPIRVQIEVDDDYGDGSCPVGLSVYPYPLGEKDISYSLTLTHAQARTLAALLAAVSYEGEETAKKTAEAERGARNGKPF